MTTEKRKRSYYTEDFKRDAVTLVTKQGNEQINYEQNALRQYLRTLGDECRGGN